MAIPKLLDKMRHSVQDTGDDNMTGSYILEEGNLQSTNSDIISIDNDIAISASNIAIAESLIEVPDESNLLRLYYDVNGTPYMQGITHQYVPQKGLQINMDYEASGNTAIITGVADPIEAQDVATKNYVDKSGLALIDIESTDGLTYTGTSESISEYKDGMIIGLIPNMNNVASTAIKNITININNLGPLMLTQYYIKKEHAYNGLGCWNQNTPVEAGFLYANEGFIGQMQYSDSSSTWYILPINPGLKLSEITDGTLGYNLSVTANSTYLNSNILRNIKVSTSAPTSSDGNVGDIWIQYFE